MPPARRFRDDVEVESLSRRAVAVPSVPSALSFFFYLLLLCLLLLLELVSFSSFDVVYVCVCTRVFIMDDIDWRKRIGLCPRSLKFLGLGFMNFRVLFTIYKTLNIFQKEESFGIPALLFFLLF